MITDCGFVLAVVFCACNAESQTAVVAIPESPPPPRDARDLDGRARAAHELFEHLEWLGREVVVDIIEPIIDAEHSSVPDPGEVEVEVQDVGPKRLVLSPAASAEERTAGAVERLPARLRAPLRVTGIVAPRPHGIRLIVHEIRPLAAPHPARLASAGDLLKSPAAWHRRYFEVVDSFLVGFEVSRLGDAVWLETSSSVTVRCRPPRRGPRADAVRYDVRVIGYAYTMGGYGHGGQADAMIMASELVFLDPKQPGCR